MKYEAPRLVHFGSIAEHTFSRCDSGTGDFPPKDHREFPHDKFGECSDGHASP